MTMSNHPRADIQVEEPAPVFHRPAILPGDLIVERLVSRAHAAQQDIDEWSDRRIDILLRRLRDVVADHAHSLAAATVAETGMGNVHDKTVKISVASAGIYAQVAGATALGEIGFDHERQIAEIASPIGVVVA